MRLQRAAAAALRPEDFEQEEEEDEEPDQADADTETLEQAAARVRGLHSFPVPCTLCRASLGRVAVRPTGSRCAQRAHEKIRGA